MSTKTDLYGFVGLIALAIVLSFLISYPLMLLWNICLVPAIAGVSQVSWIQMWGISILVGLLVKPLSVSK